MYEKASEAKRKGISVISFMSFFSVYWKDCSGYRLEPKRVILAFPLACQNVGLEISLTSVSRSVSSKVNRKDYRDYSICLLVYMFHIDGLKHCWYGYLPRSSLMSYLSVLLFQLQGSLPLRLTDMKSKPKGKEDS